MEFCRFCKEIMPVTNIIKGYNSIMDMIRYCTGMQYNKEDEISFYVCQLCFNDLSMADVMQRSSFAIDMIQSLSKTVKEIDDYDDVEMRLDTGSDADQDKREIEEDIRKPRQTRPFTEDDVDNDNSYTRLKQRKEWQYLTWTFKKMFDNYWQAQIAISEEQCWSFQFTKYLDRNGSKKQSFYKCRKKGCPAKIYVISDTSENGQEGVMMYKEAFHEHMYNIPFELQTKINGLIAHGLKQKEIMTALKELKLPDPNEVGNYISEQIENLRMNTVLNDWIDNIGGFDGKCPSRLSVIGAGYRKTRCYVLSSQVLLDVVREVRVLQGGMSYKLVWGKYVILIVGTTDRQLNFHPLCLALSKPEYGYREMFKLIFNSLSYHVRNEFNVLFKPEVFIVDSSDIETAFTEVFEDGKVRVCWASARRKIQSRIKTDVPKNIQREMLKDIDDLHSVTDEPAFAYASELFLKKYERCKEFTAYFKEMWLVRQRNWYLGATTTPPATNSNLETFMKHIQDGNYFGDEVKFSKLLRNIERLVFEWSCKHDDGKTLAVYPVITLKDWFDSCNWSRRVSDIVMQNGSEDFIHYKVPDKEKAFKNFDDLPSTLKDFMSRFENRRDVFLPVDCYENRNKWIFGRCSCPTYYGKYVCKHLIGLAIRLKFADPPSMVRR